MAIHVLQEIQPKTFKKFKSLPLHDNGNILVIFKFYDRSWVLTLLARSLILAFIFLTFPTLRSMFDASLPPEPVLLQASNPINAPLDMSLLFHDLSNEGLFRTGNKAVFLSQDNAIYTSQLLAENNVDLISTYDLNRQSKIPDESFDFAFSNDFHNAAEFVDRTLKVGGIVVVQVSNDPFFAFHKPSNYKIIYFRRFQSIILAMRKMHHTDNNLATQRRLLGYDTEAKKAALNNLEDVLLEPPRATSGKSSRYLKRTRYLPDLMGDSLESYPRRVFIDMGLAEKDGGRSSTGTEWFAKHYPTRNLDFDIYKIETVADESPRKEVPQEEEIGVSDWLRSNVKEEEYVVMKAEAEIVEELVKSKAIRLVDELFLECKPQCHAGKGSKSRRAYWECLALYGRLRDEGVAVHQWWG